MKHTKKLFAALLSLALLLGLAVPAMAEVRRRNLDIPWEGVIVSYPWYDFDNHYLVAYGEGFTLTMEATLPSNVEISYQWRYSPEGKGMVTIAGKTAPSFSSTPGDPYYPSPGNRFFDDMPFSPQTGFYDCVITLEKKDSNGVVVDTYVGYTNTIVVEVEAEREATAWERFRYIGLIGGYYMAQGFGIFSGGLGYLIFPIIYPICVVIAMISM
jgi:hypothetical protein